MTTLLIVITIAATAAAAFFAAAAWRVRDEERRRSAARVAALATAIDYEPDAVTPAQAGVRLTGLREMFQSRSGDAVQGRSWLQAAIFGGLTVALIIVAAMAGRERPGAAAAAAPAPLELMSMQHERAGATLKISGVVRNPRTGAPLQRVDAVVSAFDRSGNFLGTGEAGLDFRTLAPGDESPFVVTVPNMAGVNRYRVSFRTADGALRHVDRRAAPGAQG